MKGKTLSLSFFCIGLLCSGFRCHSQTLLTNGLIAYYPFNGNVNDATQNGLNGGIFGSGTTFQADRFGTNNAAIHFSGNGYASITPTPFVVTNDYTISFWVRVDSTSPGVNNFLSTGNDSSRALDIRLAPGAGGWAFLVNYSGGAGGAISSATPTSYTSWHQLALTHHATSYSAYIDGASIGTSIFTDLTTDSGSLVLGIEANGFPYNVTGSMDELRIYNRPFASNEISQLYTIESTPPAGPTPPTITNQPQSITANLGDTVTFVVGASGTGPISYQWYKDGIALANATNQNLVLGNIQFFNIGDYYAQVRGLNSTNSATASLNITNVNPFFWRNLLAYYPFDGDLLDHGMFGCHAVFAGNGGSYQLSRFGASNAVVHFSGSGYATITPTPFSVTNDYTISFWAQLDSSNPSINNFLSTGNDGSRALNIRLAHGAGEWSFIIDYSGLFSGGAINSATPVTYNLWHHLVLTHKGATNVAYIDGTAVGTANLTALTTDAGSLWIGRQENGTDYALSGSMDDLSIHNRAFTSNEVSQLYISQSPPPLAPFILQQPTDVVGQPFGSVTFTSTAFGNPSVSYQWLFNGVRLGNSFNTNLIVSNIRQTNLGGYSLVATNANGAVTSSVANLLMLPYLNTPFKGASTVWGAPTTLSVGAWGSGVVTYQWYLTGVAVAGETNQDLVFNAIQITNGGLYSVVVSNAVGSVTNKAYQVVVNTANLSIKLCPDVVIQGTVGYNYVIQASSDLSNTNSWITLANLTLTQPLQYWDDTNADVHTAAGSSRYYRVLPGQ